MWLNADWALGVKTMNLFTKITISAAAMVAAAPAMAATFVGATTLASPTFNRPLENGTSAPTSLSGVGTAVHYQAVNFTVATSGTYTFLMSALNPAGWDTYLGLYANSFSPTAPLTNVRIYNDDFPTIGLSGFSFALTAGTSYIALATGFDNTDVGSYSLAINGPGAVTFANAVPEPATWAMMLVGFGMIGTAMRYRRRSTKVAIA